MDENDLIHRIESLQDQTIVPKEMGVEQIDFSLIILRWNARYDNRVHIFPTEMQIILVNFYRQ